MQAVNAGRLHTRNTGRAYDMVGRITIIGIIRPVEKATDWTCYHILDFAPTTGRDGFEDRLAQYP